MELLPKRTEPGFPPLNQRVISLANRYVRSSEVLGLEEMATRRAVTAHRAEGCGCHQCKRGAIGASQRWEAEFTRLFPRHPQDHEEQFIANYAQRRLGR